MAKKTNKARSRRRSAPDWAPKFLKSLGLHGNIRKACAAAGIVRSTAYTRRDQDEAFAAQMADALEDAADRMEEVADERAKDKSDALLMFRLKALRPEKYRDRGEQKTTVEHQGTVEHVVIYVPDDTRNPPAAETGAIPPQSG